MATSMEQLREKLSALQKKREDDEKEALHMETEISAKRNDEIRDRRKFDNTILTGIRDLEKKVNTGTQQIQSLLAELDKFSNELKFMKKSLAENIEGDEAEYQDSYDQLYAIHLEREARDKKFNDAVKGFNIKLAEEESKVQGIADVEERLSSEQAADNEELRNKIPAESQNELNNKEAPVIEAGKSSVNANTTVNYTGSREAILAVSDVENPMDTPYQNTGNTRNSVNTNLRFNHPSTSQNKCSSVEPRQITGFPSNGTIGGVDSPSKDTQGQNWVSTKAKFIANYPPGGETQAHSPLNQEPLRETYRTVQGGHTYAVDQTGGLLSNTRAGFMDYSYSQHSWGNPRSGPKAQKGVLGMKQTAGPVNMSGPRSVPTSNYPVNSSSFEHPMPSGQRARPLVAANTFGAPIASSLTTKFASQDIRKQELPFDDGNSLPFRHTGVPPHHMRGISTNNKRLSSQDIRKEQELPFNNGCTLSPRDVRNWYNQQKASCNIGSFVHPQELSNTSTQIENSFGNGPLKLTPLRENPLTPQESQFMRENTDLKGQLVPALSTPSTMSTINGSFAKADSRQQRGANFNSQARLAHVIVQDLQKSGMNSASAPTSKSLATGADFSLQASFPPATVLQNSTSNATYSSVATAFPLKRGNISKPQDVRLAPANLLSTSALKTKAVTVDNTLAPKMSLKPEIEKRPKCEFTSGEGQSATFNTTSVNSPINNFDTMGKLILSNVVKKPVLSSDKKPNFVNAPKECSHKVQWRRINGGGFCEYIVHPGSHHATTPKKWLWECILCGYHACDDCQKELRQNPRPGTRLNSTNNADISSTMNTKADSSKSETGAEIPVIKKSLEKLDNYGSVMEDTDAKESFADNQRKASETLKSRNSIQPSAENNFPGVNGNTGVEKDLEVETKRKDDMNIKKRAKRKQKRLNKGGQERTQKLESSSEDTRTEVMSTNSTPSMSTFDSKRLAATKNPAETQPPKAQPTEHEHPKTTETKSKSAPAANDSIQAEANPAKDQVTGSSDRQNIDISPREIPAQSTPPYIEVVDNKPAPPGPKATSADFPPSKA